MPPLRRGDFPGRNSLSAVEVFHYLHRKLREEGSKELKLMRIGVFGDVHGNLPALEAILSDGTMLGVEAWGCVGDLVFKGPAPQEVVSRVRSLNPLVAVRGNTDEWTLHGFPGNTGFDENKLSAFRHYANWALARLDKESVQWLEELPFSREIMVGPARVLFLHASPKSISDNLPSGSSDKELARMVEGHGADMVIAGHIHVPYLRRLAGKTLVNTGSVGNPVDDDPRASYIILEAEGGALSVTLRRVPYDIERTVALAREREFPWADSLGAGLSKGTWF